MSFWNHKDGDKYPSRKIKENMPNKDSWGRDDYFNHVCDGSCPQHKLLIPQEYHNEAKSDLPDDIVFPYKENSIKTWKVVTTEQSNQDIRINSLIDKAISGKGDSDRHLITLFATCLGSHSRNILELGVRRGDTTTPLLMAARLNSGIVDSVDINDTEFECPEDLKPFWRFHKSDAIKYLEQCVTDGRKFDFIYLDDFHSYEHVAKELELIDQLVTPSSHVLIHDLQYGNTSPYYHVDLVKDAGGKQWQNGGPYRAVAELNPQFWEFSTFSYSHGLTLLRKKYSSKYL